MAGEYLMPNLIAAQILRQQVVDFLHRHPEASMDEIAVAIPEHDKFKINGTVACMARGGELKAVGPRKARRFSALVTTTASAEEKLEGKRKRSHEAYCKRIGHDPRTYQTRAEKLIEAELAKPAKEPKPQARGPRIDPDRPWITRHECGDTAPAAGSRGQGAARQRVHVNCHQAY